VFKVTGGSGAAAGGLANLNAGEICTKLKADIESTLLSLSKQVADLLTERNSLRLVARQRKEFQLDGNAIAGALRDALENKQGWREQARKVLNLYQMVPCEMCGTLFPSGGKRRNYCNNDCRLKAYRGKDKCP
jgi:hypothetical protein